MQKTSVKAVDLEIHQVDAGDIYKDVARVHHSKRAGIKVGKICKISANGRSTYAAIQGLPDKEENFIRIDEVTRERLGELKLYTSAQFTLETVSWWGQLCWACRASDPAARVSVLIAVWSLILAVAGLLLAVWSIYLALPTKSEAPPHPTSSPALGSRPLPASGER